MGFEKKLDAIIAEEMGHEISSPSREDISELGRTLVDIATQLLDEIGRHEQSIADAKMKLNNTMEQLNNSLGMEIRKRQPKLMVSHRDGSCITGYYSSDIACKPDFKSKTWNVGGKLGKMFSRRYPDAVQLNADVGPLANAITDFFKTQYRTLDR